MATSKDEMVSSVAQPFETASDFFADTGLKPLTFETDKATLAKNHTTFCISNIERTTGEINNEKVEQWMLTIHYEDDKGRAYDKLMPLPLSEMVRNEILEQLQTKLQAMPVQSRFSHQWELEAVVLKKYTNPYYNLVASHDACMHAR